MVKKELMWRGKNLEELRTMDLNDFAQLVTSRERRKLTRGFTDAEKILIKNIEGNVQRVKTHCRDMVIIPSMVGKTINIHTGKQFIPLLIDLDMLGHRLGEFALTRSSVSHSAPGVGATRSSSAISVK
jgi:small subunit ribosomal protein S19